MKKKLSLAALAVVGLSSTLTYAAPLVDLTNVFGTDFGFGYSENHNISVEGFATSGENTAKNFTLSSPIIKDTTDTDAESYVLLVSNYPMQEYLSGSRNPNLEDIVMKSYVPTSDESLLGKMQVVIAPTDVKSDVNQYAFLVPVDDNFQEGRPSKQFCFNFSDEKYAEGDACATFGSPEGVNSAVGGVIEEVDEHNAAGADMNLAGVSHSVKGNVITLTWVAQPASSSLEIQLFDKESSDFRVLATVPMSQEKFEYTIDGAMQEFIFHLVPKDARGKEKRYDLNVRTESEVTPEIKTTPRVGPVEDMMLMVAITVLMYAGYRVIASRKVI